MHSFARVFYKPEETQGPSDHARMEGHLQPAVDRFNGLETEEAQTGFKDKLNGYVNLYAFLSQIIPYGDPELEMLYSFGRFLLPQLVIGGGKSSVKLGDEVELQYYRLERTFSGSIGLSEGDTVFVHSPTDVGTGKAKDESAPLSEIINVLNERFGTEFGEGDRLFFQQIKEKAVHDRQVVQTALANPLDKFQLGIRKLVEDLMIERLSENDKIVTRYMADGDFQGAAFPLLAREIFQAIHGDEGTAESPSIPSGPGDVGRGRGLPES